MNILTATASAASLLALTLSPASAQTRRDWTDSSYGTPSWILTKFPATRRLWQSVVSPAYRKVAWVHSLEGTAAETSFVAIGGRQYAYGGVCKPHDCMDNNLAFLIAMDRSRAVGLIRRARSQFTSRGYIVTPLSYTYLGNPTPQERTLLRRQVDRTGF